MALACVKWRLVFAVLGCMGMAIIYGLKVNLSIAIVAMVNQTAVKASAAASHHGDDHHATVSDHDAPDANSSEALVCSVPKVDDGAEAVDASGGGTLVWSEPEQGLALGSYFWGYLITQVPGGRVAELYSGKWVFFIAVLMNIAGAVLSPICSSAGGVGALIAMRVVQGLGGGLTFPAMNVLIAAWAPNQERSTISSVVYGGTAIGTVLSMPTAGLLAEYAGWESIFYVQGGLAVVWCLLWALLVFDTPAAHPFVSDEEKKYIVDNQNLATGDDADAGKKAAVPWRKIWTSKPFLALCLAHTLNNFCWYMLLVELPSFMSAGLGFDIKENALLSAVPFFCNWLVSIVYSFALDKFIQKGKISTTNARKMSQIIASVVPGACLVGVCLSGCDRTAVVVLMIVGTGAFGAMFSGIFSNHTDLAPKYAGILMGITNMLATFPGFIVPALVGAMTHGKPGLGPWHNIFYLTVGLLALEVIVYGIFASGVEQEWNRGRQQPAEAAAGEELVGLNEKPADAEAKAAEDESNALKPDC